MIWPHHLDTAQVRKLHRYNLNIKRVVGDSLGGSVSLDLQKHHPELKSRNYSAPVFDLKGAYRHGIAMQRDAAI